MTATARPAVSLQKRLLLTVLLVVGCTWLATSALTWFDARHELDELLDGHLAQAAALLVVQEAKIHEEGDIHTLDAPTLHPYAPNVAFQVYHGYQKAIRSSNAPAAPFIALDSGFRRGFATVRAADGALWRVFATEGVESDVLVYVGEQIASREHILRAVMRSSLWMMLLALPLLVFATLGAVRFGLAPLQRLRDTLAARKPGAMQPLPLGGIPRDMAPMVEALNGLFGRIERLLETERRFTADAAHELRTPIAAIRAQAQVALGETDDALRRHALQGTLAGCDRATRVVEQLLTLARLEAERLPSPAPLDIVAVARSLIAELAPRAIARGQSIELEADGPCMVLGDATLLGVLLRNLLDNAMRYGAPQTRIVLKLEAGEKDFTLSVEDSGPGMAAEEMAQLGTRFFRAAKSGESGSGLGWSIVYRIAEVHGFTLEAGHSAALGGMAVRLRGQCAGAET